MARKISPGAMLLIIVIAFAGLLWAQAAFLTASAPAPAGVTISAARTIGMPAGGGTTLYYFVYARFPGGYVAPQTPAVATRTYGAAALSGGSFVRLTWTAVTGATGYDVIRSSNPIPPAFPCTACAVVLNTGSTTVDDTGGAMSAYPPGGLSANGAAVAYFTLENTTDTLPFVNLEIIKGGVSLSGRILRLIGAAADDDCLKYSATYGAAVSAGSACGSGGGGGGDMVLASIQTSTGRKTFNPTLANAGARIGCGPLPSGPAAGDFACDSGDGNKFKYYNGITWVTLQTGGSVGVSGQLGDFDISGMGTATLTLGSQCDATYKCTVEFAGSTQPIMSGPSTMTISGFVGAETAYIYAEMNSGAGRCVVATNSATIVEAGPCTFVPSPGITTFPAGTKPLWTCSFTNTTWDLGGCVDKKGWLSITHVKEAAGGDLVFARNATNGAYEGSLSNATIRRTCEVPFGLEDESAAVADGSQWRTLCANDTSHNQTVVAVKCSSVGSASVVRPIISGGAANSILTAGLTCGIYPNFLSGTLNAPVVLAPNDTVDFVVTTGGGSLKTTIRLVKSF